MHGFMIRLLICSATMSAPILFYMAVTPLLAARYSVTGRYYTWLVLVAGLIIPFRPHFNNAVVKVDMPVGPVLSGIRAGNGTPVITPAQNALPSALTGISWWQIAAAVWLAGMFLFLAYHISRHYRFLKLAAHWSRNVTDEQTLALFQTLKTQLGLSKTIGLQVCDSIGSPMMTGFANPRILLPKLHFTKEELCFILKHELVHYRRKDLWYKCLVLAASAIHWFNPVIYLMAKAIDIQCELSCDREVIRSADAETRQCYIETMIGVIRHRSKLKTALSTNFNGGRKYMKKRIISIMDMKRKKAGAAVLCGALALTLGSGAAFAANVPGAETQNPSAAAKEPAALPAWLSIAMNPDPDLYAPYAVFGLAISRDGTKLLYNNQPVRLFADEKSDVEAFYFDEAGNLNLSAVRNAAGEITGLERISAKKAQEYYERFFAKELDPGFSGEINTEAVQDSAVDTVSKAIWEGENKYKNYQPFGITYSAADGILYFHGQRAKFFMDPVPGGGIDALWTDEAGTGNLAVIRDASGRITGIENISDEKAREYQSAAAEYEKNILNGLEERVEARMNERYPED